MAALMDLRVFRLCMLVASILLMLMSAGVLVFGAKVGIIPANAVPVLSVMVWLGCVVSVMRRWFRSKRPYEPFSRKADRTGTCETAFSGGAWMLDPATGRLTSQIASEFHFNRLISCPSGSTLYGVVLGEAGWNERVQLVRLDNGMGGFWWLELARPAISVEHEIQSAASPEDLVVGDCAGVAQYAAQDAEHRTIGPSKVQLSYVFAGQEHNGSKFGVGTFPVGNLFERQDQVAP